MQDQQTKINPLFPSVHDYFTFTLCIRIAFIPKFYLPDHTVTATKVEYTRFTAGRNKITDLHFVLGAIAVLHSDAIKIDAFIFDK